MGGKLRATLLAAAVCLTAFLAVITLQGLLGLRYVGEGISPSNTITVSGEGDVYAIPDTGEFTLSVVSDKATVVEAQADASQKINAITAYLTAAGVAAADIQTTDYSISPQYEWSSSVCPAGSTFCPPQKQVLTGYEVSQTSDVKVRDTTQAGTLLAGVGGKGATNVSGLSFTIADPSAVDAQARTKAITDAKTKATELAKELGVSLARVVSFTESQGGQPVPMYGFDASVKTMSAAAPAPVVSVGQNKVVSNVSITYEIR